ncbi:MAG: MFS transporter [Lachnotalea sp.]
MDKNKIIFYNKNFSILWFGQLFSTVGNWVYSMFILIYVATLTDKAIVIAGILMTSMLPNILFGPFIGNIVDKVNKKYMIVISDFIRGILILGLLPLMNVFENQKVILLICIFVTSIISNVVGCFFDPAIRSIIPRLTNVDIKKSNSYFALIGSISLILGPAFGGTVVGILGFRGVVIFNACTFIVSAVSEMFLKYMEEKKQEKKQEKIKMLQKYKLGWSVLSQKADIKYYVIVAGIRSLVVGLINISFIFVANKIFIKGSVSVGYIYAALGCGLILGSLVIAYWRYKIRDIKLYLIVILANAIFSIIYIFTQSLVITLMAIFIVGISDGFQSVLLYSNIQKQIESNDTAKVVACTNSIMMAFQLISMTVGGLLFDYFDSTYVVIIVSIIVITCTYISYAKLTKKQYEINN